MYTIVDPIFALQTKVIVNLCKSVQLPTLQQHVDIFIAHSMPVVIVAWVSIVQSRQLGTHKHFYAYSHGALNRYFCITLHFIGLCEGWYSRFLVTVLLLQRYYI